MNHLPTIIRPPALHPDALARCTWSQTEESEEVSSSPLSMSSPTKKRPSSCGRSGGSIGAGHLGPRRVVRVVRPALQPRPSLPGSSTPESLPSLATVVPQQQRKSRGRSLDVSVHSLTPDCRRASTCAGPECPWFAPASSTTKTCSRSRVPVSSSTGRGVHDPHRRAGGGVPGHLFKRFGTKQDLLVAALRPDQTRLFCPPGRGTHRCLHAGAARGLGNRPRHPLRSDAAVRHDAVGGRPVAARGPPRRGRVASWSPGALSRSSLLQPRPRVGSRAARRQPSPSSSSEPPRSLSSSGTCSPTPPLTSRPPPMPRTSCGSFWAGCRPPETP